MTDPQELAGDYRDKAARCRRLARQTTDGDIAEKLLALAREFEEQATAVENSAERNSL
jgi:hypothetical protein